MIIQEIVEVGFASILSAGVIIAGTIYSIKFYRDGKIPKNLASLLLGLSYGLGLLIFGIGFRFPWYSHICTTIPMIIIMYLIGRIILSNTNQK